jgi:hypothetical protein
LPITLSPALPLKPHFFDLRRPTAAQCPTGWILSVGCGPKAKTVSNWSRGTYTHTLGNTIPYKYVPSILQGSFLRIVIVIMIKQIENFPPMAPETPFSSEWENPRPMSRDKLLMYSPILLDAQPSSCHLLGN